jgi:cytochrome c peroxidase
MRIRKSPVMWMARKYGWLRRGMAVLMASTMASFGAVPPAAAQYRGKVNGSVVDNSGIIPFDQAYFAFEVEGPVGTLKEVPNWDELEQLLDNPYAFALAPEVEGNFQGFPSYRASASHRRRSFVYRNGAGQPCAPGSTGCSEVPLAGHVIHPLNYNFQGGEELRLLNIEFQGGDWQVPLACMDPETNEWTCTTEINPATGQAKYTFDYENITVSPGGDRLEEDEAVIDYNSPIGPQNPFCATTVEPIPPPEGSLLCGQDPGEPGYAGFGVLLDEGTRAQQYSVPAVPGGTFTGTLENGPKSSIVGKKLFDPARGFIEARADGAAVGGLRRPSLRAEGQLALGRARIHEGTPEAPDYLHNSVANLAADPTALLASNENDYYRGATRAAKVTARNEAVALGKALFWDMQVGSDSVQSCGTCHFHAGVDNRVKGQINSNTAGGDNDSITVANTLNGTPEGANAEVTAASFPLHKLTDPLLPTDPLTNPGNIQRTTNDVLSSMGVSRFKLFVDVPAIGNANESFLPAGASGVRSLRADVGLAVPDPVTVNQGFRRVEPRHTPTFFAASMNFDNFWDGRARHDFNGGSVFGAADPQAHVFACDINSGGNCAGGIEATRQIIRFASLASLATGPGLSEFEMSWAGRNWSKVGKRLLQPVPVQTTTPAATALRGAVTPLANQLVATNDSVLGSYSNQGGSACAGLAVADRSPSWSAAGVPNRPGLCISYPALIRRAFYPGLWARAGSHLKGCYTSQTLADPDDPTSGIHGAAELCATAVPPIPVAIPVLQDTDSDGNGDTLANSTKDPFDNYVLKIDNTRAALKSNTNEFTQMEANFSLFWGLSIHAWASMLIPDDSPFDRLMDANPDAFVAFGEANENALVIDLPRCGQTISPPLAQGTACFTEVGRFKRDPLVAGKFDCPGPEGPDGCRTLLSGGTRLPTQPDPLLGLDFFLGSNLSLKNPNYNSLRCGECHAGGTFTDHTFEISHQMSFNDWAQEFSIGSPGTEIFPEPLGRGRVVSGFALEGELNGNAQDAVERNMADLCTIEPCQDVYGGPIPGGAAGGFPQGQALFDNGVYNIGVTPIADDTSRGGNDAFGWPLSLTRLALKNICGVDYTPGGDDPGAGYAQPGSEGTPGNVCNTFDTAYDRTAGGIFEETAQDQGLNPGYEEEVDAEIAQLPPYLAPWASNINVGDETQIDEVFVGLNTIMREPMLEGFVDSFGPFNPSAILGENMNNAVGDQMATWPNVNRVNVQGAFKAPPLRNVELTNPYFHDGGNLTLRQQLDFYTRGGNFPITNKAHRDFLIANLRVEDEALGAFIDPTSCVSVLPLGLRPGCLVVDPGTPGAVPMFTNAQKEQIIVSVVDFLLELTDERVAFERAPFDHPEVFVPLDATAPENGVLATTPGNREGLLANTSGVCTDSTTMAPFTGATTSCFRQVPAVGQGGIPTKLPAFLGISSGPRLVGSAANCSTVNNHYCH